MVSPIDKPPTQSLTCSWLTSFGQLYLVSEQYLRSWSQHPLSLIHPALYISIAGTYPQSSFTSFIDSYKKAKTNLFEFSTPNYPANSHQCPIPQISSVSHLSPSPRKNKYPSNLSQVPYSPKIQMKESGCLRNKFRNSPPNPTTQIPRIIGTVPGHIMISISSLAEIRQVNTHSHNSKNSVIVI